MKLKIHKIYYMQKYMQKYQLYDIELLSRTTMCMLDCAFLSLQIVLKINVPAPGRKMVDHLKLLAIFPKTQTHPIEVILF